MCKAKAATAYQVDSFSRLFKVPMYLIHRNIVILIFMPHSNLLLTLERSIWSWSLAKLMEMQGHHQISSTGFRLAFAIDFYVCDERCNQL